MSFGPHRVSQIVNSWSNTVVSQLVGSLFVSQIVGWAIFWGQFIDNIDQNLEISSIDMGCTEHWPPLCMLVCLPSRLPLPLAVSWHTSGTTPPLDTGGLLGRDNKVVCCIQEEGDRWCWTWLYQHGRSRREVAVMAECTWTEVGM